MLIGITKSASTMKIFTKKCVGVIVYGIPPILNYMISTLNNGNLKIKKSVHNLKLNNKHDVHVLYFIELHEVCEKVYTFYPQII